MIGWRFGFRETVDEGAEAELVGSSGPDEPFGEAVARPWEMSLIGKCDEPNVIFVRKAREDVLGDSFGKAQLVGTERRAVVHHDHHIDRLRVHLQYKHKKRLDQIKFSKESEEQKIADTADR